VKVVITCGPSFEPIDQVRRITNFSTGELGVLLAERFAREGAEVLCFKGEATAWRNPVTPVRTIPFSTNDDLLAKLTGLEQRHQVVCVCHAAALADFRVKEIQDSGGRPVRDAKIASTRGDLTVRLEPARKVIASLRVLFPNASIAGWKYEIEGTREEAIERASQQLTDYSTDVCFVNGMGYGMGFGQVERGGCVGHYPSKHALCEALVQVCTNRVRPS
jgi:phosphopantothenoylcysteine decarboxylase/phosphopantothenate--cysteine ligase